jgi:hypothetical protein
MSNQVLNHVRRLAMWVLYCSSRSLATLRSSMHSFWWKEYIWSHEILVLKERIVERHDKDEGVCELKERKWKLWVWREWVVVLGGVITCELKERKWKWWVWRVWVCECVVLGGVSLYRVDELIYGRHLFLGLHALRHLFLIILPSMR